MRPYFGLRSYRDTVECHRCYEMRAGVGRRSDFRRNMREAWPDYDAHVEAEHKIHYAGQIGSEATPTEWVEAMLAATREMVRCLKPCGSIWVNLGDKYAGVGGPNNGGTLTNAATHQREAARIGPVYGKGVRSGAPSKSLIGLPWRYALACIDRLGLILRAEVIWAKPNGLPESVTDRVRRSHETWFHFTVQPRYFSAVDEIREPHTGGAHPSGAGASRRWVASTNGHNHRATDTDPSESHSLGKVPGSVWSIPSQPLTVPPELGVDHFAAFPMEWPRRLIAGWSPAGICSGCGRGRRPIGDVQYLSGTNRPGLETPETGRHRTHTRMGDGVCMSITDYTCACNGAIAAQHHDAAQLRNSPYRDVMAADAGTAFAHYLRTDDSGARPIPDRLRRAWLNRGWITPPPEFRSPPTIPAVVLDPFGGTGTTALVAHVMGRHGISVDLSADYCRLAAWRTTDPGQLAQAAQVEKPPVQVAGQATLFA
jgi:DNA modification methylase